MPRTATAKRPKMNITGIEVAKQPPVPVQSNVGVPTMSLTVDWEKTSMPEAQRLYAQLQLEVAKAGRILNERSNRKEGEMWRCFMGGTPGACQLGKIYDGRPIFEDRARVAQKGGYKDPVTDQFTAAGLAVPVKICSERCYHLYSALLIQERRDRELGRE